MITYVEIEIKIVVTRSWEGDVGEMLIKGTNLQPLGKKS